MDHICIKCNKEYSSYQSLWIHNKKYHTNIDNKSLKTSSHILQISSNSTLIPPNEINNLKCHMCNKIYSRSDNLKRHLLICNKKNEFEEKQEKMQQKISILENKIELLTKNQKPITKIINKVSGNLINGNNQDIGNKQIIYKTGTENLDNINYNEVSTIFDNEISSVCSLALLEPQRFAVIKLIELVNFNESKPENHSFCSTALESPYLSYYNADTNSVNKERKRYFFARLLKSHVVQSTKEVICKSIQNHSLKEAYTPKGL